MRDLILPELSYQVTGACFRVHNELGCFRNEQQYGDALERVLQAMGCAYEREKALPPSFCGEHPGRNRIDFLIAERLILELKVKRLIDREDYLQVRRYLQALQLPLGIIVNFAQPYLHPKRILNANASLRGDSDYSEHSDRHL